jgi:hypothetical protein
MIRTPHFTPTDAQLDSLVEALDCAIDSQEDYLEYLHGKQDDPDLEFAIESAAEDIGKWEYLRSELQDMIDARPKLTIIKPFNPEHN